MTDEYWINNISHTGNWIQDVHFTYEIPDPAPGFLQTFNMYNPDIEVEQ